MMFVRFEDIEAWKKSKVLVMLVYKSLSGCRDYSFKDQMCRAVISIMNNIAEGYERRSKGSCGEVRSMNYLALELGFIKKEDFDLIQAKSEEISRMLSGLIKAL